MATDTKLNNLVINYLTQEQYDAIESPNENELYLTPDKETHQHTIVIKEGTKIKVLAVTEKPLLPQEKTLLEKMLSAIQLTNLENCYITSLLKCIPVFSPSFSEFEGCMRFFETELHAIKPSFILSLGNFTSSLIIRSPKNSNFQGKFIDLNGTPLLTTFSPSEILKNSSLKRPAWEDLKVLKSKIEAL